MNRIRLAIIGCGAVADVVHLPVATNSDRVEVTVLVDKEIDHVSRLAKKFQVGDFAQDAREVIGKVDAAILALPHHLHAMIGTMLLEEGLHVFVEKPMAMSTAECESMIKAARKHKKILCVGMARRFYSSSRFIKNIIASGLLGTIMEFDFEEGSVYNWPVTSDFIYRPETGGGVLADTGAHVLDQLLWWLGDYESVDYYDDAMGGVEADCEIHLSLKSGAKGVIRLSRIRDLRNSYILRGEKATLEIESNFNPKIDLKFGGQEFSLSGRMQNDDRAEIRPNDCFAAQFEDFITAIGEERKPLVDGVEGMRVVKLIEGCYAVRKPMKLPWVMPEIIA